MKVRLSQLPVSVQISVFISFWIAMMLMAAFIQSAVLPSVLGIPKDLAITNYTAYPAMVLWGSFIQQLIGFAAPVILFGYLSCGRPLVFSGMDNKNPRLSPFLLLLLGIVIVFFVGTMGGLIKQINLGAWADSLQSGRDSQIDSYLRDSNIQKLLFNLFFLAAVPAICEELLFRSAIMKLVLSRTNKPLLSFVITSAIFALLHASITIQAIYGMSSYFTFSIMAFRY
jgi:membrane protease YdiL (CAAX protease family)